MLTSALLIAASFGLCQTDPGSSGSAPAEKPDLAQQILDTMLRVHGVGARQRPVHAKGLVCHGEFAPSREAAVLSKAAHFQSATTPVTVRFSDGSPEVNIPDNSPDAGPRGLAIRFNLPGGKRTDIVAMSHNGFVVGNGEEFLALQQSVVATDPGKPHPWPVEEFLSAHPAAMKFVVENREVPVSFASEGFFSNDSFVLVGPGGARQAIRYKIIPVVGVRHLSAEEAKARQAEFLIDDLRARLATQPVKFRIVAQLPSSTDSTKDPSAVWPEDRRTVELGVLSITSADPSSEKTETSLAFDPTMLTEGIELSDDALPALRSRVYALSVRHRSARAEANPAGPARNK